MLKIDAEYHEGVLYVRLNGNLTAKNSYKINNYVIPVVAKHQIKYLVYNLHDLKNIDTKGLDAIINSKIMMKKNKGKMLICHVGTHIDKILKSLKIPVLRNEKEVLAYLEA